MATRRYKVNPGRAAVTEEVGAANNSDVVEVTIDLASLVNERGSTRAINKEEVLAALEKIKRHILTGNWSPA